MSDTAELTPQSYLYQRAKQIQDDILPKIAEAVADLKRQELIFRTEFRVLEAASTALPPDVIQTSELAEDNVTPFLPGLEPGADS